MPFNESFNQTSWAPRIARWRDGLNALGFGLIALLMRLWHLGTPKGFIFDEVYYAQNAHSLALHGVELNGKGLADFIVHPPVGKWLIAIGIKVFGFNEFGWRFSSAVIGSLSISLIYLVAKKLFNSTLISCSAAILTLADGLHLVHSRTALLDIFLMFFILLGFYFLLGSKHWLAGISLGLAAGVKWSGLYYFVAFFFFILYVDYRSARAMEEPSALKSVATNSLLKRALQYGVIPVVTYIASWTGWFVTTTGWDRTWSKNLIRNFWHYHAEILNFHTNLVEKHSYSANPWSWLVMGRPTSFFYATPKGCGSNSCSQEILALGTPFLWWSGVAAIAVTFGYWIARREWQSGLLLLGLAAGYLPWFTFQKRTMFSFYSIAFEPFLILIICYVISKFLEDEKSREIRTRFIYGYLGLIVLCFIYFSPLYFGGVMSYSNWLHHMWLPSWI
jgi:dolichyl-phosphate-mannose--protein O-mannosyl transferase